MGHPRQTVRGKMNPHQMNAAIPERRPATEEISGLIERVTFHNDESGFCVLRVKTPGHRDETTVIGSLPSVTAGEWLSAEGWWVRDKEHGLQFKANTMKTVPPTTVAGIERYLSSGLVKGIGPVLAKKLVGRFGAEVLAVIENRAAELQSVDGIGPKRRERICARLAGSKASPRNHAVPAQPRREHQPGGANLQDLRGAGNREGARESVHAGERHLRDRLRHRRPDRTEGRDSAEIRSTGHGRASTMCCWKRLRTGTAPCRLEKLKLAAVKLLEVPEGTVEQALSQMLTSGSLLLEEIDGEPLIFLPHLRKAEEGIAAKIKALAEMTTPLSANRFR